MNRPIKDNSQRSAEVVAGSADWALSRLGLGTVQFGLGYGISNELGQTDRAEVAAILEQAAGLGMRVLDTAPSYGEAERVLGESMPRASTWDIITKTRPGAVNNVTADFEASCRHLKRENLYGVLVHHVEDLLGVNGERLMDSLRELKQMGRLRKIGISVYDGEQIDAVLDRFHIDLIQVPVNVLDQRLVRSGHLKKLKQAGVEIHCRSVFLQGLLMIAPDRLPRQFNTVRENIAAYHDALHCRGMSAQAGALGFVRGIPQLDVIIIGVNSLAHLRENVAAYQQAEGLDYSAFAVDDRSVLDPREWSRP